MSARRRIGSRSSPLLIDPFFQIFEYEDEDLAGLLDMDGRIVPRKKARELIRKVSAFYAAFTDAQIFDENEAARRERRGVCFPEPPPPRPGFIYVLRCDGSYKIGRATNVRRRVSTLRSGSPRPLELVHTVAVDDMAAAEAFLHQRYAHRRAHGEWFDLTAVDLADLISLGARNYPPPPPPPATSPPGKEDPA